MFRMTSCVGIHWFPNKQRVKCVPSVSNTCPRSHVRRLDVKGWIKSRWKHNDEVKVKCAMWNKWIDDLKINRSPTPLPEQEQIWILDVEEMKSSSKIDQRDVSWWMSIKKSCEPRLAITTKLSKEGWISLVAWGRPYRTTRRHD